MSEHPAPQLTMGVFGHSAKENELRLPIHPRHFDRIDPDLQAAIWLEHGYGHSYGVSDSDLAPLVAGFLSPAELVARTDVLLQPKPTLTDVTAMREGQTLWGWPHCVQDPELTQLAIDKRLTLIAWESMNHWTSEGRFIVHVFQMNNEIAGYASVLHAMTLRGFTGAYGRRRRAVLIGFGNAARGAANALRGLGINEVVALTMRDVNMVAAHMPNVTLGGLERRDDDPSLTLTLKGSGPIPTAEFLSGYDVIVNCVLQDTDRPLMFLSDADVPQLSPGTLIVDVSCDAGMGFSFAKPTTFDDPVFEVAGGRHVYYYGVDHSPSYLWESATWENSEALIPHIRSVLGGAAGGPEGAGWDSSMTIQRAIEIREGIVQNPKILSFQNRGPAFPYPIRT